MNETRRRAWVKNAIIIFLAIMLILTFFSNTIMNYSLPEVAAQYAQSGSITSKIRTTATVTANSKHKITIEESRVVKALAVREGDTVQIGDTLVYLEDAESSELAGAREQLANLEKQYQLKLLVMGDDYYADTLAINNKKDEIAKAEKLLSSLSSVEASVARLESEIASIEAQIDTKEARQDAIAARKKELAKQIAKQEEIISKIRPEAADVSLFGASTAERIAAAETALANAEKALSSASSKDQMLSIRLNHAQNTYDKLTEAWEDIGAGGDMSAAAIAEQIAAKEKEIRRAEEDYERAADKLHAQIEDAEDAWTEAEWEYYRALSKYRNGTITEAELQAADAARAAAETAYENALKSIEPQLEELKFNYERGLEDDREALEKLEMQAENAVGYGEIREKKKSAEKNLNEAKTAAAEAAEELAECKTERETAEKDLRALQMLALMEQYQAALELLENESETLTDEDDALKNDTVRMEAQITTLEADIKVLESSNASREEQEEKIDNLKKELTTLQHNLYKKQQENKLASQREQLEIDELLEDIDEQKALIAKYEANSTDAKITADIAGQVASLSVTAGSETSVGQVLCEIIVTDLGYACEVTLTAEQARRVRVGDAVDVTNSWWSNIKGTIVTLRNDPKNPGGSKIAVITLEGDVNVGQSLNLTIGEKGQTYDSIVPNSAVREDNNGKFVLVVEAKSSPLGNRYIARRCDIEVLASDDVNSAVSGLMGSEFIITTSKSPITNGNQVRLVEN